MKIVYYTHTQKKSIFTSFKENYLYTYWCECTNRTPYFKLRGESITELEQPRTSLFLPVVLVSQYQAQVLSIELNVIAKMYNFNDPTYTYIGMK